jgi:hypothetical protein
MNLTDRFNFESISEHDLRDRLVNYFSTWFHVDFEITSLCRTKRIDILMYHFSDTDKLFPFGIELKKTNVKRGGDIAKWCLQASCYTKLLFNERKAIIFVVPQISGWYLDEGERVSKHNVEDPGASGCHNNINSFLYKSFGFGELQKYYLKDKKYCRFTINSYEVWDSRYPLKLNTQKLLLCR